MAVAQPVFYSSVDNFKKIMSILDTLVPFPTVQYLRISLAADNKTLPPVIF
jgi:hypothetical protein